MVGLSHSDINNNALVLIKILKENRAVRNLHKRSINVTVVSCKRGKVSFFPDDFPEAKLTFCRQSVH